jgi:hypothetical protein
MSHQRNVFSDIRAHPDRYYIIHYSCQSLYDDNEGLSPRITSIAILHLSTNQAVSFSTHAIAEELGIPRESVEAQFDLVERQLLENFYEFARDRRDKFWLHWNMQNITYGFEHLEHRYRKLTGGNPPVIPVERRINIDGLLKQKYGDDFAPKPRMASMMDLNGGRHRNFLTGPDEVEAFKNKEYIRMHNSTQTKVWFFKEVIEKAQSGKLVTASNGIGYKIDKLFDSRTSRVAGLVVSVIGVIGSIFGIIQFIGSWN